MKQKYHRSIRGYTLLVLSHLNPLTSAVVGAPQMTLLQYNSTFLCLSLSQGISKLHYCPFLDVIFPSLLLSLSPSCSFHCPLQNVPRMPFVNCRQFIYLVISLLVLRAGCGIWLYQFLIIAYFFIWHSPCQRILKCGHTIWAAVSSPW